MQDISLELPAARALQYLMIGKQPDRAILTVSNVEGVWAVELDGARFGETRDKDVARATANKRAREIQDGGRACEIRIAGEFVLGR